MRATDTASAPDTGCATPQTWYADADGDGFGDPAETLTACEAPESFVANADDCDPRHVEAWPGAAERLTDGVDDDCDGHAGATAIEEVAAWKEAVDPAETQYARYMALPGDYSGDGAPDLLVSASRVEVDGEARTAAAARLYLGPLTAGAWVGSVDIAAAVGEAVGCFAGLGDVDGDGAADLVFGGYSGEVPSGRFYLVFGPLAGDLDLGYRTPDFTAEASTSSLGGCAGPGDVDGDGLADVVLTDLGWDKADGQGPDGTAHDVGRAYLLPGPGGPRSLGEAPLVLEGHARYERFGAGVAALGDVSGDGLADFAVTNDLQGSPAPGPDAAFVIVGAPTGVLHPEDAGATIYVDEGDPNSGVVVVSQVDDLTGDGYGDVAFARRAASGSDAICVQPGPFVSGTTTDLATACAVAFGSSLSEELPGLSYATPLRDWTGSGAPGAAFGDQGFATAGNAPIDCSEGGCASGAIYIFLGPAAAGWHDLEAEADRLEGPEGIGYLGSAMVSGADWTGDGLPDLAASAWAHDALYVVAAGGWP